MIYEKYNFNNTFLNASGTTKNVMVLGELGKLIKKHKEAVINAVQNAGIMISDKANRKEIIKIILLNKRNKQLINNLSALIVASSSFDGGYLSVNGDTEKEKGNFLKGLSDWFNKGKEKRVERRAQREADGKPSVWERIGGFLNKNKETIGSVAGSLYGGLQNGKEADAIIQQQVQQQQEAQERANKQKKMLIIGGLVIVVGFIAYKFLYKKKK